MKGRDQPKFETEEGRDQPKFETAKGRDQPKFETEKGRDQPKSETEKQKFETEKQIVFKCAICPRVCRTSRGLSMHMRIHRRFACDLCSRKFSTKARLTSHVRVHRKHGLFKYKRRAVARTATLKTQRCKCSKCPRLFLNQRGANIHRSRIHVRKRLFPIKKKKKGKR